MIVAVISDTHMPRGNRRLPVERLRAADAILHAGDFMELSVLHELHALGPPVHAIRGNVDTRIRYVHDGELEPNLENRRTICRLIREWKADIVMSHRPNDYHPDHRYTGVLVMDASYMVTVPFFCPDVPYLEKNPAIFSYSDRSFCDSAIIAFTLQIKCSRPR